MNNAIKKRAVNARLSCAKYRFDKKIQAGKRKKRLPGLMCCATVQTGAENTTDNAYKLDDTELFSRPKFMVLGVGSAYPQGRQHGVIHVFTPNTHLLRLKSASDGFQSHN